MAKKESLKNHSVEELHAAAAASREELRSLRFSVAGSKNRNVKAARNLRKTVARALTEINARRSAATK